MFKKNKIKKDKLYNRTLNILTNDRLENSRKDIRGLNKTIKNLGEAIRKAGVDFNDAIKQIRLS